MRMYDLISKKKYGEELSQKDISYMIQGYVKNEIPDYQMSAMLMAIYFQGMNDRELISLTDEMAHSGNFVDLSSISGLKVDKHSTGGVGDKTTLIVGPIVAACGEKVAKMAGRGLGYTGGTIDKLESIPGFRTDLTMQEFFSAVNQVGFSVIGQSEGIAKADKKLYALRDVTATVDSIPLIAASVMSKKLAAGSDCILLDVTCGSGAFMKNKEDASYLAQRMVAIGEGAGKPTVALITNMDHPLGCAIGNSLEVIESVNLLKGNGPKDLYEVSIKLASNMLYLAGRGRLEDCVTLAEDAVKKGFALEKLKDFVTCQQGDVSVIEDTNRFQRAEYHFDVIAPASGWIHHMNTEKCGIASVVLGAGRQELEDKIDFTAGIKIWKKTGDKVKAGEPLATLYSSFHNKLQESKKILLEAYEIGEKEPAGEKLVLARVTKEGIEWV